MRDFQVVCPACRVTFPVGQKRCLHCGGPLLRAGEAPVVRQGARRSLGLELDPEGEEVAEEIQKPGANLRRALLAVWLLMALGGSLLRSCWY